MVTYLDNIDSQSKTFSGVDDRSLMMRLIAIIRSCAMQRSNFSKFLPFFVPCIC